MSNNTGIEWTDATWNPIRGCSRVSEGCRNCYAPRVAHRFSGPGQPYEGLTQLVNGHPAWTGKVALVEKHLLDPLKWKPFKETRYEFADGHPRMTHARPRRIFVNSMSDLFHPNVPDEWIDRIFAVMALCPQHTFQVLTKRPERMLTWFGKPPSPGFTWREGYVQKAAYAIKPDAHFTLKGWPLPNVHLGVSVEDQKAADERIPLLLQTPAAVRFISAEPLLGEIGLDDLPSVSGIGRYLDSLSNAGVDPGADIATKLDWVICGGESGPGARPMHPDWARGLRDQCVAAGVPFFFKQWGEWSDIPRNWPDEPSSPIMVRRGDIFLTPGGNFDVLGADLGSAYEATATPMRKMGKKAAGSLLDGREWKEFPRG